MSTEVGVGYVRLIPTMRGFAGAAQRQMTGQLAPVAGRVGQNAGQTIAQGIGGGMTSASAGMRSAGQTLTQSVSLPLAGLGLIALKMSGDFEASMNRVKAVSGATGRDFEALQSQAKQLGATTQFSATEAADGMGFLAMAGFKTNDIMSAMPGVLNLAAAGQLDLASAADIASNILSGYGFKAEDIGRINDVLAKTFTSANVDMRMLGESFKYVGPVAKSLGLEFEEASAAIGLLGNAGIQGSMAGTTLRMALVRLTKPPKQARLAIEKLGLQTTDSGGKMLPLVDIIKQLETAGASTADMMRIFGVEAGPGMQALVSQGSKALQGLTGDLQKSGGTADRIAKTQMEGLNGEIKILKSAFEGLMIAVGDSGLLQWATRFVTALGAWVQGLSRTNPMLLRLAVIIGGVLAVVGPVLAVIGMAIPAIGTALALLASPVALVVGAVVLLAGAFAVAMARSESFRATMASIAGAVKTFLIDSFQSLYATFQKNLLPSLQRLWQVLQTQVWPALQKLGAAVLGAVVPVFKRLADIWLNIIWPAATKIVGIMIDKLQPILKAVAEFIATRVVPAVQMLGEKLSGLLDAVRPVLSFLAGFIVVLYQIAATVLGFLVPILLDILGPAFTFVWDAIGIGIDILTGLIRFIVGAVKLIATPFVWLYDTLVGHSIIPDLINGIVAWFTRLPGWVAAQVGRFKDYAIRKFLEFVSWAVGLPGRVGSAIGGLAAALRGRAATAFQAMRDAAGAKVTSFVSWVRGLPGMIARAIGNLGSLLYGKGQDVVRGLWNGIRSMGGWLKSQLISFARNMVPGPIAKALGIASPSKVMAKEVGRWIPAGIVAGIEANLPDVSAATRNAVTTALPAQAQASAPTAASAAPVTVVIDGSNMGDALWVWLKNNIRVEGGGIVQTALGYNAR